MFNSKVIAVTAFTALATFRTANAQDDGGAGAGLAFIEDTTDTVLSTFDVISISVVTIAILWAGFGMLFTRMSGETAVRILFGGALIGAAPQVAQLLVGTTA